MAIPAGPNTEAAHKASHSLFVKEVYLLILKAVTLDWPDGPVAEDLPANARDTSSIPGLGRFHMPQGNEACVPQLLNLLSGASALQQKKSRQWEACVTQLEKAHAAMQTQYSQKSFS